MVSFERPASTSTIEASLAVSVAPGRMLFTVMPKGASSRDRVLAHKATEPRTVLETPSPGMGCLTEVETMLMIRPKSSLFMPASKAWTRIWLETRCWVKALMSSSGAAWYNSPPGGPPELLTRM